MKLYEVLKDILWHADMDWSALMSEAHQKPVVVAVHFDGNFRRGRVSRRTAQRLSDWLKRERPKDYMRMTQLIEAHEPVTE